MTTTNASKAISSPASASMGGSLFLPPQLTEIYEPVEVLGHGAFAIVVLALDRRTRERVAIKHFHARQDERRNFFRELKFMLSLQHKNIARCIDLFTASESSCDMIFEYADLGTLRGRLRHGHTVEPSQAIRILIQIARGLCYAHGEGIVHRDMKPENILVFSRPRGAERFKITDFGIAKFLGQQASTYTSIGSPAYMAPEQFYDSYGFKTDIYSLGVMLFEMLHGKLPYEGSAAAIFKGHLEGEIRVAPTVDSATARLIARLMAKKEAERPDAQEALELLEVELRRLENETYADDDNATEDTSLARTHEEILDNAEAFFDGMFGRGIQVAHEEKDSQSASAVSIHDLPLAQHLEEDVPTDEYLAARAVKAEQPVLSQEPESEVPERHTTAEFFSEGFEDARSSEEVHVTTDLRALGHHDSQEVGSLTVSHLWSRAVDTKARSVVNTDENLNLMVRTEAGLYEVTERGSKGPVVVPTGLEVVGTPASGQLPVVVGGEVRVLHKHALVEGRQWFLDAEVDQLILSPRLDAVVAVVGHMVCFHDAGGNHAWTGRFDETAERIFASFDQQGRLMVVPVNGEDHAVHFYNAEGEEVVSHWLPGRILAATRCRRNTGAWLVIERRQGCQLFRVAVEGQMMVCSLAHPLVRLVGARHWIAGQDAEGRLYVIDTESGAAEQASLPGEVLDFEQGCEDGVLMVLEGRGEVLKYLSAFRVKGAAGQGE